LVSAAKAADWSLVSTTGSVPTIAMVTAPDVTVGLHVHRRGGRRSSVPRRVAASYCSGDPAVIAVLYAWFAAQLSDHGRRA